MYRKIAAAIAFSPRMEAILSEANRLKQVFDSELILIHVGEEDDTKKNILDHILTKLAVDKGKISIFWEKGDPVKRILSVCRKQDIDLLLAGALKKENIFRYYIGSVARKILRKSPCSVLVLIDPSTSPKPFKRIVIHAGDKADAIQTINTGCTMGQLEKAKQLHIIKEIKMYGLTMALAGEDPEHEYSETRRNLIQSEIEGVEKVLKQCLCDNLKINIKIASGKSGYELAKFAHTAKADLMIVEAPSRALNIFDRMFPHDLEYILADLPCNLLLVQGK